MKIYGTKNTEIGTYTKVHKYLIKNFGKATQCENGCKKKLYQWALIKGKKYECRRYNFMELCISCHKIYDMFNPNRKGEQHPQSKLSDNEVRIIRKMSQNGFSGKAIATKFKISSVNVCLILKKKRWGHVV